MKSGFVSIIGRPNVGKSTLINSLVKEKIAITSNVAQTTRNNIQGIYNDENSQIIFVDTPGIHKPHDKLGTRLNEQAYYSLEEVDVVLLVVDITKSLGPGDLFLFEKLKEIKAPIFLILNKIDLVKKSDILIKIEEYSKQFDFKEIFPVSSKDSINTSRLISVIKSYLKDEIRYYDNDDITNTSLEFRISELVREKILMLTFDEVPHTITCFTEEYKETKDKLLASVLIIVERDSVKKIILGKQGSLIKEIGIQARIDIEKMVNKKVYLDLYVKVIKKWRDKDKYLKEFGFYN